MVLKTKLRSSCLYGECFAISPNTHTHSQLRRSGAPFPADWYTLWQGLTFSYKAGLQTHCSLSPLVLGSFIPRVSPGQELLGCKGAHSCVACYRSCAFLGSATSHPQQPGLYSNSNPQARPPFFIVIVCTCICM